MSTSKTLRKYFPDYGQLLKYIYSPTMDTQLLIARRATPLLQEALIALLSGEAPLDAIDAYDGESDGPCKIAGTATHRPAPDQESAESADVTAARASVVSALVRRLSPTVHRWRRGHDIQRAADA